MSGSSRAGHIYGDISAEQSRVHLGDDLSTYHNSFVFNVGGATISDVDKEAGKQEITAWL